jgi:ubiquinol-cytochrome c reductase cytochrome b subunit
LGTWLRADPADQRETLEAAEHSAEHAQLTAVAEYQDRIAGNGSSTNGHSNDSGNGNGQH